MNVKAKSNWTNKKISYLKNVIITEYDLASGGLSVIKEFQLLSPKIISQLDKLEKKEKNIAIGKIQAKRPNLAKQMVEGFGKAREKFVIQNNIQDENILSIKKDALFLINCVGINGKVSENLIFRKKNSYTSYLFINNKEMLYSPMDKKLDIKGLSSENKKYQEKYLLKDIATFLGQAERISHKDLYKILKQYRSDYLNKKLPIETYRNLDTGMFMTSNFEMETIDETFLDDLDISYNFKYYIMPIIQELLK